MSDSLLDLVCIGVITAPHGVSGMVLVKSFTQIPADIKSYPVILNEKRERMDLKFTAKSTKDAFIAKIDGVTTRNDTEKYRRVKLYVERASLPKIDDEAYYHIDLLGCSVTTLNGLDLGHVKAIYNYGAGDILEVSNDREICMIPFHTDGVPVLELEHKRITVDDNFVCGRE